MTTQTLIALVDSSAYAESVCRYAGWIAGRTGSKVKLYHVMGRREATERQDLSGTIRLGARTRLLEQLAELDAERAKLEQEHGRALLEDARRIIREEADIEVETRLRRGDLIDTVTAKEETGDLIVVGKRGAAAGLAREHLGSNVERIVRVATRPVFVANRAFRACSRVLVAFDGAASSLRAIDTISRSELFAGLEITVVFAGAETPATRASVDSAVELLRAGGLEAGAEIRRGTPETVLSAMTQEGGHDLLVMGAYGHSRVRSLLVGSTTTEMIRSCKVPVLLVR